MTQRSGGRMWEVIIAAFLALQLQSIGPGHKKTCTCDAGSSGVLSCSVGEKRRIKVGFERNLFFRDSVVMETSAPLSNLDSKETMRPWHHYKTSRESKFYIRAVLGLTGVRFVLFSAPTTVTRFGFAQGRACFSALVSSFTERECQSWEKQNGKVLEETIQKAVCTAMASFVPSFLAVEEKNRKLNHDRITCVKPKRFTLRYPASQHAWT